MRNKLRHARIRPEDAHGALVRGRQIGEDDRGNTIVSTDLAGRRLTFVIAADDPRLVITVILRRD